MSHFILEIGTEEIPARFLPNLEKELIERFSKILDEQKLHYETIEAHSTPRRALLHIYNLEKVQPKHEEIAMGPSVNIAYDAEGNLTKAGEGFVRGQKVNFDAVFKTSTEKGEYIAVRKEVGGRTASEVLAEICPQIIHALPFPKRMRWGSGDFAYARPLHWIVALLDDEVIKFSIDKGDKIIHSDRLTFGHRIHGIGPFSIKHADDLESTLFTESEIICDAQKRRELIIQEGDKLSQEVEAGAKIIWFDSLLDEVQGLVEKPVPIIANFDDYFLELPREVLLTSMEHHQKCFGLEDKNGKLLPLFLTVLNVEPTDRTIVKQGWERVLRARLEDGRFYWKEDLKDGFDSWLSRLDNVIFLGPLGSMGDKTRRLEKLCVYLSEIIEKNTINHTPIQPEEKQLAHQVGRYSKADLMSQMVGEFDTLQGIMGGIYALKNGLSPKLAMALQEQYLPSGPDSPVPTSHLGAILSIADKVDTLVGCFGLGNIPTGTADPYALRRAALGIARITIAFGYDISLKELFENTYSLYSNEIKWKLSKEETLTKLQEFYALRLKNLFVGEGTETLVAEAIMNAKDYVVGADNVWATSKRLQALKLAMTSEQFIQNAQTLKRMHNILAKANTLNTEFDSALFEAECEKDLAQSINIFAQDFDNAWKKYEYERIMPLMEILNPKINAFFEGVMVMADEEKIRQNRMNMLFTILHRMEKLADFSLLQL